ncbi:SLBB domain-containing protein [Flavobacterium sp. TAB 87]|uniref:SLBB domain-containing protein n=1 Tax=Flavobacterium sp. TAB 87 TaxID=1729581 RepID=UPI00076DEAC1|nr:SLBB domain-containing protein [Flavobacterium sp. TAB 87]KVV13951.1 Polysialic acid transport protein KpsD precursor [Flavobacterium sp. TAB 87]
MKKIVWFFVFSVSFLVSSAAFAQDILKGKDLSTVQVDYMSDADVLKVKSQLDANKMSIEQAEGLVIGKGMPPSEFAKLKQRVKQLETKNVAVPTLQVANKKNDFGREQEKINNNKVKDSTNALVFGSELFDIPTLNFEPDLKLATPVNYVLGPGDELQISVYGVQQFSESATVSLEGKVSIQYVGELAVSGMTIEAATQKIKNSIARVYSTVGSGQSQVSVTLSGIRTIRVTLIGSKQPGNYSVSSLATVYNALFLGGGPSKNGSYRNIELIRNNKVYKNIDIYRFLTKGDQSDNISLKDNDVIRIPSYSARVTVEGEVKRAGIFEMKKGETLSDLLLFASGFTDLAYTASVNVLQKTGKEFKVQDIKATEFGMYQPQSGDVFRVSKILNRFENRITIEGAVFRPNIYSFYEGMRISDLIKQAEGLKEDAYSKRVRIIRLKSDLTTEIINANLEKALSGDLVSDIALHREDIVTVYSILDFREEYEVTIDGEVKNPGTYPYFENLTLNDLVAQVGGFTGTASKRVEVARLVKSEVVDSSTKRIELINLEISAQNNEQLKNFVLEPFDVINIRRIVTYEKPELVVVSGAVLYPGKYALAIKKETVYSVIQRAGGLNAVANAEGMKIKRPIKQDQIDQLESVDLRLDSKDSTTTKLSKKLKEELKFATIPVNWDKIAKDQSHYSNVTLFPGDEIIIAEMNEGVKVTGNVLLTSEIPYRKGKGFRYYLDAVGGENAKGWKKKAYIIYPNGKADVTSSFLFFRNYPKVEPDSQIVVPEKPETTKMSTGEWVSIGSVITSLALLIVTAFR